MGWTTGGSIYSSTTFSRATSQPFQHKGQDGCYTDGTSGLVYCGHRYYDPNVGRWTSRDPTGLDGGVNVYQYVEGDPVMGADPSGLDDDDDWFSWGQYFSDVGEVLKGEASALNPIRAVKGI